MCVFKEEMDVSGDFSTSNPTTNCKDLIKLKVNAMSLMQEHFSFISLT